MQQAGLDAAAGRLLPGLGGRTSPRLNQFHAAAPMRPVYFRARRYAGPPQSSLSIPNCGRCYAKTSQSTTRSIYQSTHASALHSFSADPTNRGIATCPASRKRSNPPEELRPFTTTPLAVNRETWIRPPAGPSGRFFWRAALVTPSERMLSDP
ncbi:hypothetical protein EVAR_43779_1 [Eumeta japonica]|uniref:Uncharacterized protein n=1 Tax=Eumeta variegata TaxID=151549 RepID=A0A4C1XL70_EUMVA|nr:hypothetical protein EVAR_43779_1 [Eumeta japonica]